jgi:hypothetical protein
MDRCLPLRSKRRAALPATARYMAAFARRVAPIAV